MFDSRHPIEGLTPTHQLFLDEATLQGFIWANRMRSTSSKISASPAFERK